MPAPVSAAARLPWSGQVAAPPPEPAPSLLESVPAAVRSAVDQVPYVQEQRINEAYGPLASALAHAKGQTVFSYFSMAKALNPLTSETYDHDRIWREIDAARARDAASFPGVPKTREEFERGVLTRQGGFTADSAVAARGGMGVQLVGGLIGGFADPVNVGLGIATGGLGAESGFLRSMLMAGSVNAGIEAVETPINVAARARLGEQTSAADMAIGIGTAFAFGAGLHGAIRGTQVGFEKAVAAHWERLPEGMRSRWTARGTLDPAGEDKLLADMASALIGPERMTDAEAGAAAALTRQAEIDARNPFQPNGAGSSAHLGALGERLAAILSDTPAERAGALPGLVGRMPGNDVRGFVPGQRIGTTGDVISRYMRKNRAAETSGNDLAQAATSSAFGRYQFTKGTWIGYYTRRFGTGGLSRAEILAKRADGKIQDVLMADLTADNAARLQRIGAPQTEGNLYLMHLLGPADAEKVLRAAPDTPLAGLIDAGSIAANKRIMAGKTAADIRQFAARRMGSAGDDGAGLHLNPPEGMDAGLAAQIDAELADVRAQTAQIEAELKARGIDTEAIVREAEAAATGPESAPFEPPFEPVPVEPLAPDGTARPLAEPLAPMPAAPDPNAGTAEAQALAAKLRDVVGDKSRNLNDIEALASELGATPQDVRAAMLELVKTKGGGVAIRRKDGAFVRRPAFAGRRGGGGPMDVLDFIASKGGIRDDEGHGLGLIGLSRAEREAMKLRSPKGQRTQDAQRLIEERRANNKRNWQKIVPGYGPLLRHEGKSIDAIGEALHEAGYLDGAEGGRPTTAEVLNFIEQRIQDGTPRYTREDMVSGAGAASAPDASAATVDAPFAYDPKLDATHGMLRDVTDMLGLDPAVLDYDIVSYAATLMDNDPMMEPGDVFSRAFNDYMDANRWDAVDESGSGAYEDIDYAWPYTSENSEPGSQAGAAAPDRSGPQGIGSDAPAGGERGGNRGSDGEGEPAPLEDMPPEQATRFLDPTGEAAKTQIDALEHDARMAEIDAGFAENRNVLSNFQKGMEVEYDYQNFYRDGSARTFSGTVVGISSKDQGIVHVQLDGGGNVFVAARQLRKKGTSPATLDPGAAVDPNIAAKARQENAIAAQQPLTGARKTGAAQDPVMPEGLFGGAAEPVLFDMGDGSPPKSRADLLRELDDDAANNATIRDCMNPNPGAGA